MNARKWIITVVLLALGLIGGKFGCRAMIQSQREARLDEMRAWLEPHLENLSPALKDDLVARLEAAQAQLADGELSPIALDTLRNRLEAVLADGKLFPREAEHLQELLADFPEWQDDVHALKYMGQR